MKYLALLFIVLFCSCKSEKGRTLGGDALGNPIDTLYINDIPFKVYMDQYNNYYVREHTYGFDEYLPLSKDYKPKIIVR